MKKIIFGLALLASASVCAEEIELVRNAEIVGIQNIVDGNMEAFSITLKGGTGMCADKEVKVVGKFMYSRLAYPNIYATALTAFSMQLKTVSLGSALGKKDCDQITYIKLTR
ncbi:MAG: DUF5992 family protein [Colwellia sp.]|nr:DUF5992 family protein [Colwellia sp.]MCW8863450.1 DUF5992 family protein [Colwellia sp.]MCW9081410.1 DUF5992 family protein [Colwellia sp.]